MTQLLPKETNFIILEDEHDGAYMLRHLLFEMSYQNVNIFDEAKPAMDVLRNKTPDVLFLDINLMGEYNGIDVLKFINVHQIHTHVIVVTGHNSYSSKVIRYSPIDFLLKPIDKEELQKALKKVAKHNEMHNKNSLNDNGNNGSKLIEINSNYEINYYLPQDISYIEADGSYSHIYLINGMKDTITQNLGKLVSVLPLDQFVRVSRQSIVNVNYIRKYNKKSQELILNNNEELIKIRTSKKYMPKSFI